MSFDIALAWSSLPLMLRGLLVTVSVAGLVMALGLLLAVPLTLARMSRHRILSAPAAA